MMEWIIPRLIRLERVIRPRYWPFWRKQGDRIIGGLALVLAIVVTLPIPLGNWLPALATALLGLALSERDGVLLAVGGALSVASIGRDRRSRRRGGLCRQRGSRLADVTFAWKIPGSSSSRLAGRTYGPSSMRCGTGSAPSLSFSKNRNRSAGCSCAAPASWAGSQVAGQLGTMVFTRLRKLFLSGRDQRGLARDGMEMEPRSDQRIVNVASANSLELAEAVRQKQAEVVLLAGCRLLSKATLAAIHCPVLNYHAGITPKYRGMNGGYWALATGDCRKLRRDCASSRRRRRYRRGSSPGPRQAATGRQPHQLRLAAGCAVARHLHSQRAKMHLRGGSRLSSRICRQSNGIIRRSGSISGPD